MSGKFWFREEQYSIGTTVQVEALLEKFTSEYQEIEIYQTVHFGRMMVLDGCIMFTERDEFIYHEMLVHPAARCHPSPKRVLIIGGGDGGTAREVLRYPSVESVDLIEIDPSVVEISKRYFPALSSAFSDPRLHLRHLDGAQFVAEAENRYDLIFIDSTDPVGPAKSLTGEEFFQNCRRALTDGGILALQSESPFLYGDTLRSNFQKLSKLFENTALYSAPVISYPTGWWCFIWASDSHNPHRALPPLPFESQLYYYNSEVHSASFALPNFLREMLSREPAKEDSPDVS